MPRIRNPYTGDDDSLSPLLSGSGLLDPRGSDPIAIDPPGSEEDGKGIPDRKTWFRGGDGNAPMWQANLGSRNTRGDSDGGSRPGT